MLPTPQPEQDASLAAAYSTARRVDDPGPRYRPTPYGWEPTGAFKPAAPIPPDPAELLLRLIQETTDLGVPPKRALKWWTYILASLRA
jgi:hypothetical protein